MAIPDRVVYINTQEGRGVMITPVKALYQAKVCGCWIIELDNNRGNAFVPCGTHEAKIAKIVETAPVLPEAPKEDQGERPRSP